MPHFLHILNVQGQNCCAKQVVFGHFRKICKSSKEYSSSSLAMTNFALVCLYILYSSSIKFKFMINTNVFQHQIWRYHSTFLSKLHSLPPKLSHCVYLNDWCSVFPRDPMSLNCNDLVTQSVSTFHRQQTGHLKKIYNMSSDKVLQTRQSPTNQSKSYKPDKFVQPRQCPTNQTKSYNPDKVLQTIQSPQNQSKS